MSDHEIIKVEVSSEKSLFGLSQEGDTRLGAYPFFKNEAEVGIWRIWADAIHVFSAQKRILTYAWLLLGFATLSWTTALFLWAWGPPSRMNEEFLKWWLATIGSGFIGATLGSIVDFFFRQKRCSTTP